MKQSTISVVMPTFNSASFILPTLESIFKQTLSPFEIIISDDGSSDETCQLIDRYRHQFPNIHSQLLTNAHGGPGAARNAGILAAQGDWIAFIDSDDVWHVDKLAQVQAVISIHDNINFICHAEQHVFLNGSIMDCQYGKHYSPRKSLSSQLYRCNLFSTSAVICRRQLLLDHGVFDETLMSSQDYELWLRLSPFIRPYFMSSILGIYKARMGNITTSNALKRWRNLLKIALRYQHYVGWHDVITKISLMTASMTLAFLRISR